MENNQNCKFNISQSFSFLYFFPFLFAFICEMSSAYDSERSEKEENRFHAGILIDSDPFRLNLKAK